MPANEIRDASYRRSAAQVSLAASNFVPPLLYGTPPLSVVVYCTCKGDFRAFIPLEDNLAQLERGIKKSSKFKICLLFVSYLYKFDTMI